MKSYLRFLSRNKLYTAIEVVGLSLALAFVIVLSSYIVDDMSVNKDLKNTENIYICHNSSGIESVYEVPELYDRFPEIEESLAYFARPDDGKMLFTGASVASYGDKELNVATVAAEPGLLDFFTFQLAEGNPKEVLVSKNSVIISEELAATFFSDGDALGKVINLYEGNAYSGFFTDFTDIDVDLVVTGVFKPFPKSIFNDPDMIIGIDLFREMQKLNYMGMLRLSELSFLRIREGADVESLSRQLTEEYRKTPNQSGEDPFSKEIRLTQFDDIKMLSEEECPGVNFFFCNIRNGKLFGIYLIMCIFLTVVALLDYVVLTIAFSRFRIKEIATRQLLGTGRRGVIGRCFAEAFMLLLVSCFSAVLIALVFKDPVGQILGSEIHPLSYFTEYLVLIGIVLIMVGLASAVPSIILSSCSAINVIKGEARYKDKIVFGKAFIGIAGLLCIGALSICFGITRQTGHLMNQPLGYETEDIILVSFLDKNMHRYIDELQAESYVSRVGSYVNTPDMTGISVIADKDGQTGELRLVEGDRAYFEILGIAFLEDFAAANGKDNIYLCQSTYESIGGFMENNVINYQWNDIPVCGTISDIKLGRIIEETAGKFMGINILNDFEATSGQSLCIKTDENVNEVIKKIKEFYYSKGYDDNLFFISTLEESLKEEIREEQNILKLLTGFSIICILMTIMTIIGLSSYQAKSNERSNAVRNVFGCTGKEMICRITFDFTLPVVLSAAAAIPIAYTVIGRWLEGYVIRTDNSPVIYLGAFAVVLTVTIAAVVIQAIRMMRTNPAEALKKE